MPYRNKTGGGPLSVESARKWFKYEPETGRLFRKMTYDYREVGTLKPDGHRVIGYNRKNYTTTYVIWLIVYGREPVGIVEHRDKNPSNDRLDNLREATQSQNMANINVTSRSKSGVKGVFWDKERNKWSVYITKDYKTRFIGRYESLDEANDARLRASQELFGEFAL